MSQTHDEEMRETASNPTFFFSCKMAEEQKELEKFQRADISLKTLGVFLMISITLSFGIKARVFQSSPSSFNIFSGLFGLMFEVMLGLVLFGMFLYLRHQKHSFSTDTMHVKILGVLENLFVITLTISRIMTIAVFILYTKCKNKRIYDSAACDSGTGQMFPEGLMAMLLVYPTLLSMIVKSVKSETVIFCWTLTVVIISVLFMVPDFNLSIGSFVVITILSLMNLWEFQRQKISTFFMYQELRGSQNENERLEKENRASELKHLIGNVAHDLKTPLSSLNMGIDLITTVLEETSSLLSNVPSALKDKIYNNITCVEEHLQNMRNVNAFMLMNINRCMDYTKATNGLKLVPHIETAPLIETVALPLHVMSAMQGDKARIELRKVPDSICGHIITDKQWLEENILCLLSNAVKYSHKGIVTVSILLVEREKNCDAAEDSTSVGAASEESMSSPRPKQRNKPTTPPASPSLGKIMINSLYPFSPAVSTRSICVEDNSSKLSSVKLLCVTPVRRKFGPFLRVEVEDTGIGLSDEIMQSLFSPFKQAQRLAGGTGLGLFSLSRRVEAIGGRYGVMKRHDGQQGSVFWFEIPYKPDLEYSNNLTLLASSSTASPSPLLSTRKLFGPRLVRARTISAHLGLRILLVEDTLSIQKMTRMLLQKQGHAVTVAENGVEALELIATGYKNGGDSKKFDVVLMDFQMPIMDGLEATRRIRALEVQLAEKHEQSDVTFSSVDCPAPSFHQLIIGLSANSDDETVQLARSEGMDDFMEKPFKAAGFNEIYQRMTSRVEVY